MRAIIILVTVFVFGFNAFAKVAPHQVLNTDTPLTEISMLSFELPRPYAIDRAKVAILYKMKENIIRRELSFTPRKKWMKWV